MGGWNAIGALFSAAETVAGAEGGGEGDSARSGRMILLVILAILLVLRVAYQEWSRRR